MNSGFGGEQTTMKKNKLKYPDKKISKTFLEFSSPLIDVMGDEATQEMIKKALQITFTVWNSIVIDNAKGNSDRISALREGIQNDPMTSSIIEDFVLRKNELFANDLRMIGDFKIIKKMGKWTLRAEARDPSGL